MISFREVVNQALNVYKGRDQWTYLQGAIGHLGESDRAKGLYNYFWNKPDHSGNTMTMPYDEWLEKYGKGRYCTDCSNFINFLLGFSYSKYSTDSFYKMNKVEGKLADAPAGTVLCMKGHVGLSVGNGEFIDFYKYNETCRKAKISESLFEFAVYVPEIEYDAREIKNIEVKVNDRERFAGDFITPDDFTVTAEFTDGTKDELKTYQYYPLTLTTTGDPTVVAITYLNIVTYVAIYLQKFEYLITGYAPDKETAEVVVNKMNFYGCYNVEYKEI